MEDDRNLGVTGNVDIDQFFRGAETVDVRDKLVERDALGGFVVALALRLVLVPRDVRDDDDLARPGVLIHLLVEPHDQRGVHVRPAASAVLRTVPAAQTTSTGWKRLSKD